MRQVLPCAARAARTPETSGLLFLAPATCLFLLHRSRCFHRQLFAFSYALHPPFTLLVPFIVSASFSLYRAQLVLRVRHQVPIFPSSFFGLSTISVLFFIHYPVFCRLLSIRYSIFVCRTRSSSCNAYATIKHLLSLFFLDIIRPSHLGYPTRSISLHGFRNLFSPFISLFLSIALLSSAN